MEKEFIPYNLALELKELGFDKRCFTTYTPKHLGNELSNPFNIDLDEFNELKSSFTLINLPNKAFVKNSECVNCVSAPLWQQAFRFFREKYGLHYIICKNIQMDGYGYREVILLPYMEENENTIFKTYEEAELECLVKLIEIAKEQNVK